METMDLPTIDETLIDQKPAAAAVATVEKQSASLKQVVLDSFAVVHKHCAALAERYRGVVFDHSTPKGRAAAKAARLELREQGRYAVQRLEERLTDEANDLKRTIKAEAAAAIALTKPAEDDIDAGIKAWEKAEAERKAAEAKKEAERVAGHQAAIAKIRAYLTHAQQPGMTSARISAGMDLLRDWAIGPEFEEFAVPAANAQCETLEAMRVLRDEVLAREQAAQRALEEAERIEAQRLENERIAAEQAERQRLLDEQTAELQRQRTEVERQLAENRRMTSLPPAIVVGDSPAAMATAAAIEGKADNPEPGTLEAAPITPNARESGSCPADAPACASSEADTAQASLCGDEGPARADHSAPVSAPPAWFGAGLAVACARDSGLITEAEMFAGYDAIRADQVAAAVCPDAAEAERISGVRVILAGPEQGDEGGPVAPAGPPALKLGTISERLGFTLTEGFLETLGFPPAARERAARLYHESDWPAICDELVVHVLRCKSGEGA